MCAIDQISHILKGVRLLKASNNIKGFLWIAILVKTVLFKTIVEKFHSTFLGVFFINKYKLLLLSAKKYIHTQWFVYKKYVHSIHVSNCLNVGCCYLKIKSVVYSRRSKYISRGSLLL